MSILSCHGSDSPPAQTNVGGALQFTGEPSKLYVQNEKSVPVKVFVTFGGDSCITQANMKISGGVTKCEPSVNNSCVFTLANGERQEIQLELCRADLTFRFNSAEGCGTTKAEVNMNVPNWDDTWNISLVDGWNENVRIDIVTSDIGTKTMGPTQGKTGNQRAFGVYPYGCDVCTARQKPPCGIEMGDSECKTPNGVNNQYSADVPCQWNHPRSNTVTVSVLD